MTSIIAQKIKIGLIKRGVDLNASATETSIKYLEDILGFRICTTAREIFLCFDGFVDYSYDDKSMISMWSVGRITGFHKSYRPNSRSAVGDFFVSSELITSFMREDDCSVRWQDRDEILSKNIIDFYQNLLVGVYDR